MVVDQLGWTRELMKIFDAKLIANSYLSNLIATRLLNYAKRIGFTPKNIFNLNLSGYHQANLKSIFPKAKVTEVAFANLRLTYFPAAGDNINLFIANLAFAKSPELIFFFNETNRLLKEEDILLLAVHENSEQHVRDSLENIDLNFISFKEKINFETDTYHIFIASRDELTTLIHVMEPEIEDYTESDHIDEMEIEDVEANDPIFQDGEDIEPTEEPEDKETKLDIEDSTELETEEENSSQEAKEVEDEADPEGEGDLDEESETDHDSDSDQDAAGDWEQDEAVDADHEPIEDEEHELEQDDTELDDDADRDVEEDDELDDDLDDDEELDDEEDEEFDDEEEDTLEDTEELDEDDGEPEKSDTDPIVEDDKKSDTDNDNDEEENTKSFRR